MRWWSWWWWWCCWVAAWLSVPGDLHIMRPLALCSCVRKCCTQLLPVLFFCCQMQLLVLPFPLTLWWIWPAFLIWTSLEFQGPPAALSPGPKLQYSIYPVLQGLVKLLSRLWLSHVDEGGTWPVWTLTGISSGFFGAGHPNFNNILVDMFLCSATFFTSCLGLF